MIATLENLFIFALSGVVIAAAFIFILGFCIATVLVVEESHASPPSSKFKSDLPLLTIPFETFLSLYEADSAAIKLENLDKDKYAGVTHAIISTDEGPVIARFSTVDLWKLRRWYKPIAKAERKRREDIACAVHAKAEQKSKQQLCEREILATQMLQHHTRKLADQYQEQLQEAYAEMQRLSTKEVDKTINMH